MYVCCLFISRNNSIQKKTSEEEALPREIPLYSFPVVCVIVWLGGTDALGASLVLINNFLSASLSLSCPRTSSFYVTFIVLPCKTVRCTIERYNNAPVRYITSKYTQGIQIIVAISSRPTPVSIKCNRAGNLRRFHGPNFMISFAGFDEFAGFVILRATCWFRRNRARFKNAEIDPAIEFHETLIKSRVSSPKPWFRCLDFFCNYLYYN